MNIYISNLSYAVNDGDLKDLFGEYGEISHAKLLQKSEMRKDIVIELSYKGFG